MRKGPWRMFQCMWRYFRVHHLSRMWMMMFHIILLGCTLGLSNSVLWTTEWVLWIVGCLGWTGTKSNLFRICTIHICFPCIDINSATILMALFDMISFFCFMFFTFSLLYNRDFLRWQQGERRIFWWVLLFVGDVYTYVRGVFFWFSSSLKT